MEALEFAPSVSTADCTRATGGGAWQRLIDQARSLLFFNPGGGGRLSRGAIGSGAIDSGVIYAYGGEGVPRILMVSSSVSDSHGNKRRCDCTKFGSAAFAGGGSLGVAAPPSGMNVAVSKGLAAFAGGGPGGVACGAMHMQ